MSVYADATLFKPANEVSLHRKHFRFMSSIWPLKSLCWRLFNEKEIIA